VRFESYRSRLLPAIVRFWNLAFRDKPGFLPMTEALFRARVTGHRSFRPEDLLLALSRGRVIGLVHVGRRGRGRSRQGCVALLAVDPGRRHRGVGTALWNLALERLRGAGQVVVVNAWDLPFYRAGRGRPPLWGSSRGMGVEWRDAATRKFLARKGYVPRARAAEHGREWAVYG
jgi:GNAT superfamily N-acetyltransferase